MQNKEPIQAICLADLDTEQAATRTQSLGPKVYLQFVLRDTRIKITCINAIYHSFHQ